VTAPLPLAAPQHDWAAAALAGGAAVKSLRPGSWQVVPAVLPDLAVRAALAEDFLCLHAGVPSSSPDAWGHLLEVNTSLAGLAKFALDRAGRLCLRAEIPLAESEAGGTASPPDLGLLCSETGWPFSARSDGRCSVTLETPRLAHAATVEPLGGGLRITTDLVIWDELAPAARQAVAAFLLEANALVRMARATLAQEDDSIAARLEVTLAGPVRSDELGSAFAALSVGCALCPAHLELLQDEGAAQDFLAVRGGPCDPGNKQANERNT